jgi:hypothetical protein
MVVDARQGQGTTKYSRGSRCKRSTPVRVMRTVSPNCRPMRGSTASVTTFGWMTTSNERARGRLTRRHLLLRKAFRT